MYISLSVLVKSETQSAQATRNINLGFGKSTINLEECITVNIHFKN